MEGVEALGGAPGSRPVTSGSSEQTEVTDVTSRMPKLLRFRRGAGKDPGPTCQELVELLTDYLEGALPADQAGRVRDHLGACPLCAAYLEQMRATIGALGHLPAESVPPPVEDALIEAFRDWRAS